MKRFILLIILSLTQVSVAATTATDVKEKAGETADAAADYTKEQKEAFVKEMEKNLTNLKAKIKELKNQAGKSKDKTIENLEIEQKNLEKDLTAMKSSSGRAWAKLKSGLTKAWIEVKNSMSEAKEELKK